MKRVIYPILLFVAALPVRAAADIFQWTDDAGVTHYTNLKTEVPVKERATVQVLVDEAARRQASIDANVSDPPAPVAPVAAPAEAPPNAQLAEAVYDRSEWVSAYLEGLQRGLTVGGPVASGGGVEINGPLAVTASSPSPDFYGYNSPYFCAWPYSLGCDVPYFYPGVAVFRRERFRHAGPLRPRPVAFGKMPRFGHSHVFRRP